MNDEQYSLGQLADTVGIAPRTIRFYIARGLLPGPEQAGRNAKYGAAHRERLQLIDGLKPEGLTLAEIGVQLEEGERPPDLPAAAPLAGLVLSEDVQVLMRTDVPPWKAKQIRRILAETARQLKALG